MFIAYNGFAQNNSEIKKSTVTTFPNGDEAITIIENSDTNVIKLISSRDFNEYEMLDLSNHEVKHRLTKKREIIKTESKNLYEQNYAIGTTEKKRKEKRSEDKDDAEGA